MRHFFHRKPLIEIFKSVQYKDTCPLRFSSSIWSRSLADIFLLLFFAGLFFCLHRYLIQVFSPMQAKVDIELSPISLLQYTSFSLFRGVFAYILSLIFSLIWGIWSAKDKVAEKALIPLLDVLQSIPVLGFMPGFVLLLIGVFPTTNLGLELAAILMIFTGQAWNMAFGVYHAIRTVPFDKIESAQLYQFSSWQSLRWIELPFASISLVWNSMMSMAGGWFFLMISEAFQLGSKDFRLPGLGSYMSVAAAKGDFYNMLSSIVAMILLIVFLDQCLWRPLVAWSRKFSIEDIGRDEIEKTWFLEVLKNSILLSYIRTSIRFASNQMKTWLFQGKSKQLRELLQRSIGKSISLICLFLLLSAFSIGLFYLIKLIKPVSSDEWLHLMKMAGLTFSRVLSCLVIGLLVMVPLGLGIGLSPRLSKRLQPILQITASFPATLLFPAIIWLMHSLNTSLEITSLALMLTGTVWYLLFNILAGTKALPQDLKEVSMNFHFSKKQNYRFLYLPGIFPYLVTGTLTAAGGAWNASIVAEYISYQGKNLTVPGLGSSISQAAADGNIPLLVASIFVMAALVVLINYQVWLRLYHYSEQRFALNY
jgi:NitT/TauT family transport system permease protein